MKNKNRGGIFLTILFSVISKQPSIIYAMEEDQDDSKGRGNSSIIRSIDVQTEEDLFPPPLAKVSLDSITSTLLSPGVYESDNME